MRSFLSLSTFFLIYWVACFSSRDNPSVRPFETSLPDLEEYEQIQIDVADVFGKPGSPCKEPTDCDSLICVPTPEGYRCASLCASNKDCFEGLTCENVVRTDVKEIFACVHPTPKQCWPCLTDNECNTSPWSLQMKCAGVDNIYFCLQICGENLKECPERTHCSMVTTSDGHSAFACVPTDKCSCRPYHAQAGAVAKCEKVSPHGVCSGEMICEENGFSPCSAGFPEEEKPCDGIDNNCDGQTDESGEAIFYFDKDQDGFGGDIVYKGCNPPPGYIPVGGDCDDDLADINPDAVEICNKIDDNCNGQTDEGLETHTYYKDNDGDGFASIGAVEIKDCKEILGYVPSKDYNGDGSIDWDCDDMDATTYPGAPEFCDGKDNDCDLIPDRFCFSQCLGEWPYKPPIVGFTNTATFVDLDGDGFSEIVDQNYQSFSILDTKGKVIYEVADAGLNKFSLGRAIFSDLDDYDLFNNDIQGLEIITANGNIPTIYKMISKDKVVEYSAEDGKAYSGSKLLAFDFDRDGVVEFVTSTSNDKVVGSRIWRFDKKIQKIKLVGEIKDPDGVWELSDGRMISDLDNDGMPEFIFGNGWEEPLNPEVWAGHIYARKINLLPFSESEWCNPETCFTTFVENLVSSRVRGLFRYGDHVVADVIYFKSKNVNAEKFGTMRFEYTLNGDIIEGYPQKLEDSSKTPLPTDIDDDDIVEYSHEVETIGLWDVNGDGYPDRIYASENDLKLDLFDPIKKTYVEHLPSKISLSFDGSLAVKSIWDANNDGKLDVLSKDAKGNIFCHSLGQNTFNPWTSLPPYVHNINRTYQYDNFEPDDGQDIDGDGLPDAIARIPSAITSKPPGLYAFISHPKDHDFLLINTAYKGAICLLSPPNRIYSMAIWSFADKLDNFTKNPQPDGKPDGKIYEDTSDEKQKCFDGYKLTPNRTGEYKFIVEVYSKKGWSTFRPYWIWALK